jgi:hypothetical protein
VGVELTVVTVKVELADPPGDKVTPIGVSDVVGRLLMVVLDTLAFNATDPANPTLVRIMVELVE